MTDDALRALQENSGKILAFGVVLGLIGLLAIANAAATTVTITMLVGICSLASGVIHGTQAFRAKEWGVQALSAVVLTALGLLILTNVLAGAKMITLLLAVFFVVQGAYKISYALKLKPMKNWNFLLFSGILALLLGLLLWFKLPVWALGLMVGIDLLFGGWSMVLVALAARASKAT